MAEASGAPGARTMSSETLRALLLFAGLGALVSMVFALYGALYSVRLLAEAAAYAVIALGLTIQWGYGGLFNVGVMGFVALGGFMVVFVSTPINLEFWASDSPAKLLTALLVGLVGAALIWATRRLPKGRLRAAATALAVLVAYAATMAFLGRATTEIEDSYGFIGGLGLPTGFAWIAGAGLAALVAWGVGGVCLGLRSDYLAIATLGVAEIVRAILKNADWLTRGTLTVSPLPWPTPTPEEIGVLWARALHLSLTAVVALLAFLALQRAYYAPWGRMIRAIRDNEAAAAAMGKSVDGRRLEIFVLGAALMGLGGAILIGFSRIFDPAGFQPLNHTFLIWVMVIVGGSGNNLGAIFGAVFVYIIWTMSEPAALALFDLAEIYGRAWFGWEAPSDLQARALQMRVFVIGLTITLALRFAPRGALPEPLAKAG